MDKIAGAILAGGKSSRMGKNKANLRLRGKTFLQHMGTTLKAAGIEKIYISHPDIIPDEIYGCGPLSGIHAILKNVPRHHKQLVFVPIDMPGLTASLVNKLISAPDDVPLVHFESYKVPFRLSTDRHWLKLVEELLRKGDDVSLGTFQKNIPGSCQIEVLPDEQSCFTNINTPKEWYDFTSKGEL